MRKSNWVHLPQANRGENKTNIFELPPPRESFMIFLRVWVLFSQHLTDGIPEHIGIPEGIYPGFINENPWKLDPCLSYTFVGYLGGVFKGGNWGTLRVPRFLLEP